MTVRQIRQWRRRAAQADRELAEQERRIVDMAKRLTRLEAEVELAERAASKREER